MIISKQFKPVLNQRKYIKRIFEYNGQQVCELNSVAWFEQHELDNGDWYVPFKLLDDIELYYIKFSDGSVEGYALYTTTDNYVDCFDNETECLNWLTDKED